LYYERHVSTLLINNWLLFPPLKIKQAPGIQWADIAGLVGSKGHKEITEYPFECRRLFVQIGVIHPVGYFLLLSWL